MHRRKEQPTSVTVRLAYSIFGSQTAGPAAQCLAACRRQEVVPVADAVRTELGMQTVYIEEPGTMDGGQAMAQPVNSLAACMKAASCCRPTPCMCKHTANPTQPRSPPPSVVWRAGMQGCERVAPRA